MNRTYTPPMLNIPTPPRPKLFRSWLDGLLVLSVICSVALIEYWPQQPLRELTEKVKEWLHLKSTDAAAPKTVEKPKIYFYNNAQGRTTYVNNLEDVPARFRDQVLTVNLNHTSENSEIGADLRKQTEAQLKQLRQKCTEDKVLVEKGWLRKFWDENGHLVVIVGLALGLLFMTPSLSRKLGGQWNRTLMFILPLLFVVGLMSHTGVQASKLYQRYKSATESVKQPKLCGPQVGPDALAPQIQSLTQPAVVPKLDALLRQ